MRKDYTPNELKIPFLTHIFSQINAMIAITLPIPRNKNARNKSRSKCKNLDSEFLCLPRKK